MKKLRLLLVLWIFGTITLTAQDKPQLLDPNIRYGVLDNGLTYYILHNEEPKDRASFYIVHNVGAVLEEDDQNGLAHMLEHLAFNGSANFKGKGVKNFLERQGVEFGKNINAYTNIDETVYNISNVPAGKSEVMDSCVLILHDWSGSLTMAGEEIDAERGVIKEEWRQRNSPQSRMRKKLAPTTFYKSKYAVRDVIGNMDVVEKSPYSAIRSFYKKWYRPDLQAVVIVGDFDVDKMEARTKRILSKIPMVDNPAERVEYTIADNTEFLYDYATDDEAQIVQYSFMNRHSAATRDKKGEKYMVKDLMSSLYGRVINERLANIQQKPASPYISARVGYFNFVRTTDVYYIGGAKPAHMSVLNSMEALLIENERIKRYGITATELDRAKITVVKSYEEASKNQKEVSNDQYAMSLKDHFLKGEPKMGATLELKFAQAVLPQITAEAVNELVKRWFKNNNLVITVQGPSNIDYPKRDQIAALLEKVKKADVEPFIDKVVTEPLIANKPKAGKITGTAILDGVSAKEYTLSNGAKVVIYPTDKNNNEILFQAYSPGGKSLLSSADLPTANVAANIADLSGIGAHSLEDLRQLLVGKQVSLQARINQYSERLEGSSTPEDIETLMQLIHMTFEAPRFEKESFETLTAQLRLQMENAAKNLQKVFFDTVSLVSAGGNLDRRPIQNKKYVDLINFERVAPLYKDRFKDAGDFVFTFVGAVDETTMIPLLERYIGSISDSGRREEWKDEGVRSYGDGYEKVFSQTMEVAKQTNYIKYQGETKYSREGEVVLSIAKGILSQRYFETIREQEGGSYGVGVYNNFFKIPYDNYSMIMYFDCNPDKADKLVQIIHGQMEDLLKNGPTEDAYKKAVEGMAKTREQSLEQNKTLLNGIINQYSLGYNTALPENFEDILSSMTMKKFTKSFKKIMGNNDTVSVIMKPE